MQKAIYCKMCNNDNVYKQTIDNIAFVFCPDCQYSARAKHYFTQTKEANQGKL